MSKLLLALQFWERDKPTAMKVARLIADLEPEHSEKADFLFMARFDCAHDQDTVKYVSRKFNVHTAIGRRRGTGWPQGCNDAWFSLIDFTYEQVAAKKFEAYKAILTFEADSCPIIPNWITKLHEAWDKAKVNMLGVLCPHPVPHINGNLLLSAEESVLYTVSRKICGCPGHMGWDWALAKQFKALGWADCPRMRSLYAYPTLLEGDFHNLLKAGVCFLHGVKDLSAISHVRNHWL